eukprot:1624265-Alexandrium_andersonii.AAC.1
MEASLWGHLGSRGCTAVTSQTSRVRLRDGCCTTRSWPTCQTPRRVLYSMDAREWEVQRRCWRMDTHELQLSYLTHHSAQGMHRPGQGGHDAV